MARDEGDAQASPPAPTPNPGLRVLDRLVGTWRISGGSEGEVTYEWMEGGFFLIQRGWVKRPEGTFSFMQVIGYDRTPGQEPGKRITGRLYTSTGDTLQYTSESKGDDLTIWMGEKGSPAFYKGTWSADGNVLSGAWEWPGGGYEETMTRLK